MADFAQNLNYATEYQRSLEQAFPYVLYFGRLYSTPNNGRFRWVNSKTIEIPSISTSGRTNADRDSIGTAARNYNNAWETKTLQNERKWSTLVHPRDIDETNQVASIANITKVFNEEHKFPEMDAYTISKIFYDWTTSIASSTGHNAYVGRTPVKTVLTTENILGVFDGLMLKMDNARIPVSGRVLYVTYEIQKMLNNAQGLYRQLSVQQNNGNLDRKVNRLDEVEIIPIPAELMKTLYDFSDVNGWAVDQLAWQVEMLLVSPAAVITPVSYSFSNLQAPSALTEGKYYYYEESFEDVFILNMKADAIQFVVDPAPIGLSVTSAAGTLAGDTKITVSPAKGTGNAYMYVVANDEDAAKAAIPEKGTEVDTGFTSWDGSADITAATNKYIVIVECVVDTDSNKFALKAGYAKVTARA